MPAKAGTQGKKRGAFDTWIPAFAGVTMRGASGESSVWFRTFTGIGRTHTGFPSQALRPVNFGLSHQGPFPGQT